MPYPNAKKRERLTLIFHLRMRGLTYEQIGAELGGLTKQRVEQLYRQALRRMGQAAQAYNALHKATD